MSDNDNDDEAEKMRLAFESFMLTGKAANDTTTNTGKEEEDSQVTPISSSKKKKKKKKKGRQEQQQRASTDTSFELSSPLSKSSPSRPYSSHDDISDHDDDSNITNKQRSSVIKRYHQIYRTFRNKVQHTWMHTDDQLFLVVENIVSIRGRLPHSWSLLSPSTQSSSRLKPSMRHDDESNSNNDKCLEWMNHGCRHHNQNHHQLQKNDIQLALFHDITQHEKMLSTVRSMMSNMSECLESLGRDLNLLLVWHYDHFSSWAEMTESSVSIPAAKAETEMAKEFSNIRLVDEAIQGYSPQRLRRRPPTEQQQQQYSSPRQTNAAFDPSASSTTPPEIAIVESMTKIYHMLSKELYRKQCLAQLLFDSVNDDIFGHTDAMAQGLTDDVGGAVNGLTDEDNKGSPLQIARTCRTVWPRTCKESCVDEKMLSSVLAS